VKEVLCAVWPLTVAEKIPDDAPVGTIAVMLVLDQFVATAAVPLSEIVLVLP
jgi:hypothetical protein